ncbi:conjugal transfer protein [Enterococcus sp. LJL90]
MSEPKKFVVPETAREAATRPKKQAKKKQKKREKKEPDTDTRSIRFNRNVVGRVLSTTFFLVFFCMAFVCLMLLGRMNTLTSIANRKVTTEDQIIAEVTKANVKNDAVIYEGYQFLETFFNYPVGDEARKERETALTSKLATNLEPSRLETVALTTERTLENSTFIEAKTATNATIGDYYVLTYDVVFSEGEETYTTQVVLDASFAENEFKLVSIPTYINYQRSSNLAGNDVSYSERQFYTSGKEVDQAEKQTVTAFVTDFFQLYCTNDKNLALISNVTGLTNAECKSVTIGNMVRTDDDKLIVEGVYSFSYDGSTELKSSFSLELDATQGSYFVNQFM